MMTDNAQNPFRERRSAYIDPASEGQEGAPAAAESRIAEPPAPEPRAEAPPAAPRVEPTAPEPPRAAEPSDDVPLDDLDEMAGIELPEPSFHEIVYEYAIRAQQFLGDAPLTRDGERRVLPTYAKHMIDLLGILEERTRGNRTPEESQLLEQVLADLRARYVSLTS